MSGPGPVAGVGEQAASSDPSAQAEAGEPRASHFSVGNAVQRWPKL